MESNPSEHNVFDGLRILLVDDSQDGLESFAKLLAIVGGDVKTAASGSEALAILNDNTFDLLISDIGYWHAGYGWLRAYQPRTKKSASAGFDGAGADWLWTAGGRSPRVATRF
jgi:response regulator RpfG family c-di-GMP phosphodiesterase